jgi:hypothetical protein
MLAVFMVAAAYRFRHGGGMKQRSDWCRALAIIAILFVIYAARAAIRGTAVVGCDVRIAVSKDVTAP